MWNKFEIATWKMEGGGSKLENGDPEASIRRPVLFGWTKPGRRFGALVKLARRIRCSNILIDIHTLNFEMIFGPFR